MDDLPKAVEKVNGAYKNLNTKYGLPGDMLTGFLIDRHQHRVLVSYVDFLAAYVAIDMEELQKTEGLEEFLRQRAILQLTLAHELLGGYIKKLGGE